MWALLTSAFLFSFKKYLTDLTRNRLTKIEHNQELLALDVTVLPLRLVDSAFDFIWVTLKSKWKHFMGLIFTIVLFHLFSSFYQSLFDFSLISISILSRISRMTNYYVDNSWQLTFTLVVVYLFTIAFYWDEAYAFLFQILSLPVWLSLLFLSSKLMGSYRPLFTIAFICLTCLGIYSFVNEYWSEIWISNKRRLFQSQDELTDDDSNEQTVSSLNSTECKEETSTTLNEEESMCENQHVTNSTGQNIENVSFRKENTPTERNMLQRDFIWCKHYFGIIMRKITDYNKEQSGLDEDPQLSKSSNVFNSTKSKKSKRQRENSDKYFILLVWLFICVKLRYDLYIAVPIMVVIWKLAKKSVTFAYKSVFENANVKYYLELVKAWLECRKVALAPKPFLLVYKLFFKGDHKVNQLLQKSLDNLISGFMIIGLLLFVSRLICK